MKAKCTPIDILYQAVNPNFDSNDSFTHIFEQTQYCIAKCKDAFPLISWNKLCTWLLFLKGFPKGIRSQLATECRPDDIDELQSSIQRFASSRSRTIGSYFIDFKPKSDNVASNSSKPKTDNATSNFSKHVITNGNKIKASKPQSDVCSHCSKSGHVIDNC